ncbi:hypothetical protein [Fulvivirga sp.]|uniref:hypothetical protein n=1 Tax=Fulvivirga sp. TaxID=1931237 RepID=UPI0032ED5F37
MKKRYIVCVNNSTEQQDQTFLNYIREQGFGWWHYLNNIWLLTDSSGKSSIKEIRDHAKVSFDDEYNMVFQLNETEGTWSGFGPNSETRNMFTWIKKNWK